MKKILWLALAALMLATSVLGCAIAEGGDPLRVAVVLVGTLGDQSYNDAAWSGIERAEQDFNIDVQLLESMEAADWESNVIAAAAEGYDMVICVSSDFESILTEHAPEFPDTKFVITDGQLLLDNVLSVWYAQNEGSFLAGAAAAMFTQETEVPGVNEDAVIGWVGGMDVPALHEFYVGFEQGAKYVNPDIKILQAFAGSFNDPLKGKELTLGMYADGADIVMNVAANTGNGVLEAAKESGLYAIDVDIDQDSIYPGSILCSLVKNVGAGTYEAIARAVNGTFEGNTILYEDLAHDGLYLTDMSVMRGALGEKFPEDIPEKLDELRAKVASGEITVDHYPGYEVEG